MVGTIRYSTNWCWLEVDHDLGRMCRWLFLREYGIKLQRPSNGEHITLTYDFERSSIDMWGWWKDRSWDFFFNSPRIIYTNENAFWLNTDCHSLRRFRRILGLPGKPEVDLHFCIGYIGENNENAINK